MQRSVLWTVTLCTLVSMSNAQSCSWLTSSNDNTTTPADGYSPCSNTSSAVTCCGDTDACLSNGYCTGSYGLYRGACTDWAAGVCPETCAYSSSVSEGETYYLANLYRCNGEGKGEIFWCGDQSADTTSQPCQSGFGSTFTMTSIGTVLAPLVAAATANSVQTTTVFVTPASTTSGSMTHGASVTSAASSATSAASSATPSGTHSNSSSVPLGVGLGIGLGVPLLAAIGALLYLLARTKRREPPPAELNASAEKQEIVPQSALSPDAPPYEQQKAELHGKQLHEVPSPHRADDMAELGSGSYRGSAYMDSSVAES